MAVNGVKIPNVPQGINKATTTTKERGKKERKRKKRTAP